MELCWSALKPWIANAIEMESATPNSVFEEVELAVGCPKEKDHYWSTFPGVDHLVQPITDGEIKIFAYFHDDGNKKLSCFSRHMIEISKYRVKVLDAEVDSHQLASTSSESSWSTATTHRLIILIEEYKVHQRLEDTFNSPWFFSVKECMWDMDRIICNTIRNRNLKAVRLLDSNSTLSEERRIDRMINTLIPESNFFEANSENEEERSELDVIGLPNVNNFRLFLLSDTESLDGEHSYNKQNNVVTDNQILNSSPLNEIIENQDSKENEVAMEAEEEQEMSKLSKTNAKSSLTSENNFDITSKHWCFEAEQSSESCERSNINNILITDVCSILSSDCANAFETDINSECVERDDEKECLEETSLCFVSGKDNVCAINAHVLVELDEEKGEENEKKEHENVQKPPLFNLELNSQTNLMGIASLMEMINQTQPEISTPVNEQQSEVPQQENEQQSHFNLKSRNVDVENRNLSIESLNLNAESQNLSINSLNLNAESRNLSINSLNLNAESHSPEQIPKNDFLLEVPNHSEMIGNCSRVVLEDNVKVADNSNDIRDTDVLMFDEDSEVRNSNIECEKPINEVFGFVILPGTRDENHAENDSSQSHPSSSTNCSPVFRSGPEVLTIVEETPLLPSIAEVMDVLHENEVLSDAKTRTKDNDVLSAQSADELLCSKLPHNLNGKFRGKRLRSPGNCSQFETGVSSTPLHCFNCSKRSKVEEQVPQRVVPLERVRRGSLPENDIKFLLESWKYVFSLTAPPERINHEQDAKKS